MTLSWIRGQGRFEQRVDSDGFTLLETMVALVILGVALLAVFEAASQALRAQGVAEHQVEAVSLAEYKMNTLVAFPLDSLRSYSNTRSGWTALGSHRYMWSAVARQVPKRPQLWRAAVVIEWEDGEFDLETTFYRRESVTIQESSR